jgi:NAD+ diphosphatase
MQHHFYATSGFDRMAHFRDNDQEMENRFKDPTTLFVPVWNGRVFTSKDRTKPHFFTFEQWNKLGLKAPQLIYLGQTHRGNALAAVDISQIEELDPEDWFDDHISCVDLRGAGLSLSADDASIVAYAQTLLAWHKSTGFCGKCGSATLSRSAGHTRRCTGHTCETEHFPRINPAVIMLVEYKGRTLLASNPNFPEKLRSILAGFVEPGESLEQAVAREVWEEAGIEVDNIQYHSSQPWPFSSSIMLGFTATAKSSDLTIDQNELLEADWYNPAEIDKAVAEEELGLPRPDSIAGVILREWMAQNR